VSKALAIGVAAFVLGNTLIDTETTLGRAGDLHEHGSMLDAPQGTHQHGDEKDHHHAPNSPFDQEL
jgi:hypothetical protein